MIIGISPNNKFVDKSKPTKTFNFFIFEGRNPLNEFEDKSMYNMHSTFHKDNDILEVRLLEPKWGVLR